MLLRLVQVPLVLLLQAAGIDLVVDIGQLQLRLLAGHSECVYRAEFGEAVAADLLGQPIIGRDLKYWCLILKLPFIDAYELIEYYALEGILIGNIGIHQSFAKLDDC